MNPEVSNLGREAGGRDLIHSPASLHEFLCKAELFLLFGTPGSIPFRILDSPTECCSIGNGPWHEADEMIHLGKQLLVQSIGSFGNDGKIRLLSVCNQMLLYSAESLIPHIPIHIFLLRGLHVLFDQVF